MDVSEYIANREFREDLKLARLRKHLTQKQVAERTGLSAHTIGDIENPEKFVNFYSILMYIDALGYEIQLVPKPACMVDDKEEMQISEDES